jgi:hypothetical protein
MPSEMRREVSTPHSRGSSESQNTFVAASTRELLSLCTEDATLLLREREGEGDSARGTNAP